MPIKIGFVNFTALDPPRVTDYAAYKKLQRLLEPDNHVKTIFETHPPMPPLRFEPPALNRTPDFRVYRLAAELAPWMDEFHHRILDRSRIRERLKMVERTHFQNDRAEWKYYRQVDLLHAWITELLFERVYRRVGRNLELFEKAAKREWEESTRWHELHKDKRLEEAKRFPELHKKELVHPYRFEVKVPNDKKVLQTSLDHILDNRRLLADAKSQTFQLRQLLYDMILEQFQQELVQSYKARHHHFETKSRWHLHDIKRAFDRAWVHAWDSRDNFRDIIRQGILEQAEYFPRLFRQSLVAPFELEIREPNEWNYKEKMQQHILQERQQEALVKLGQDTDRRLLKTTKQDLATYRQLSAEQLDAKAENSSWQEHVLVERHDQKTLETRDHTADAKRVESQGYQWLAGRMIPQPRFAVDTDTVTQHPLSLGVQGDPRAPEHIAPTPLLLVPAEQKKNWQKLHDAREGDRQGSIDAQGEAWLDRTQGLRQNLAALDYAEQSTHEIPRTQAQNVGSVPSDAQRQGSAPAEPIKPLIQTKRK